MGEGGVGAGLENVWKVDSVQAWNHSCQASGSQVSGPHISTNKSYEKYFFYYKQPIYSDILWLTFLKILFCETTTVNKWSRFYNKYTVENSEQ
jgi:hypothetical protein